MPRRSTGGFPTRHSESIGRVGLALGGGAARGWAHIGVIRTLQQAGIHFDLACGSSIGALVGAALATGNLDRLEAWVLGLDRLDVARLLDVTLSGGGFIQGDRVMETFARYVSDRNIAELDIPFGCVATDLETGREIWLQSGSLLEAVRASIALPGLFTPAHIGDRWLVDGGLVDPVPVSLCRAMGADLILAVNLNSNLVGRRLRRPPATAAEPASEEPVPTGLLMKLHPNLRQSLPSLLNFGAPEREQTPGLLDVLATSINIMQERITRSRMAGDPPDVLISPRLAGIALMEFHRGREAMDEGAAAARRSLPAIRELLRL